MKIELDVVGAVIVEAGKILCAQRGVHQSLPLLWEFPGGKVEAGETYEHALQREIVEELRCEIKVGNKITTTIYEYDFGIVYLTTYMCRLVDGEPIKTEHKSLKWVELNKLQSLKWADADIPTIEILLKEFTK